MKRVCPQFIVNNKVTGVGIVMFLTPSPWARPGPGALCDSGRSVTGLGRRGLSPPNRVLSRVAKFLRPVGICVYLRVGRSEFSCIVAK